jgi:hypothetical protein
MNVWVRSSPDPKEPKPESTRTGIGPDRNQPKAGLKIKFEITLDLERIAVLNMKNAHRLGC